MKAKPGYKLELSNFQKYEEIPNDWNLKTLDDVGKIVGGGTPKTTISKYWDGDILWATPTDLTKIEENFIDDTGRKISQKGLDESSAKLIEPGNLIFSSRATVGECKINTKPITTNQGFQNIIPKKEHDKKFVFYTLLQNKIKFIRFAYGTTFLEIGKNNLKKVKIVFPENKKEESEIANILSNLDILLSSYRKIIKNNKSLKIGLMQQLLTKGIGHKKFKKIKWLFGKEIEIPEEWDVIPLSNLAKVIDSRHFTPKYVDKGFPLILPNNITESGLDLSETKFTTKEDYEKLIDGDRNPEKGNIVYTRNASFGVPNLVVGNNSFSLGQDLVLIKSKKIESYLLFSILNSQNILQQLIRLVTGSTFKRINLDLIRNFLILSPNNPIEESRIAEILFEMDKKIHDLELRKSNLEIIKKGLMQKLLTGQIRVKV